MSSLRQQLEEAVTGALVALVGPEGAQIDPLVRATQDPQFGDFQSNVAMGLAKRLGRKPREVAADLVAAMRVEPVAEPPEIAGPGFINFRVRPAYLAELLAGLQADSRMGVPLPGPPSPVSGPVGRTIVDFSSPNLAKEMHVGHLRSTIIGDAIARVLEFQGHDVLRLNHVGDWGTQFGMLIQHVRETQPDVLEHPERFRIDDLEAFYREAKQRFDGDPAFADAGRRAVVDLQSGEEVANRLWQTFCAESLRHAHEIYDRMGICLEDRGESFYNPMLPEVVREFEERGLAVEAEGAVCIFLDGFRNREGGPLPIIIRKSDGAFNYDTTDLAGIKHRVQVERARRITYVVDIRQRQHFDMVFTAARAIGWAEDVRLEHVGFGMVLGPDRRPFKTREGGTVKLADLLDEAGTRATAVVESQDERRRDMGPEQRAEIARAVGLGAVKYADLSHNLASDYVFDWDTMLAMDGNTAPYMLYAYARIRSIGRRAGVDLDALPADVPMAIEHPSEVALAKELVQFPGVVQQVGEELHPHVLTEYLYGLSRAFSTFYDREHGVRVIDAEPQSLRLSRLRLCEMTARILKLGLDLLGIGVVEQM